ncbi:initiation factor 2, partial [Aureobasidium pullulans]
ASSSQSLCSFCAGRINPHARQTSIARSNAFHSTAIHNQDFSDPFSFDPAEEARKALQEAKRQREAREAALRKQEEESREKYSSQRLFGPNSRGTQQSQPQPKQPQQSQPSQQKNQQSQLSQQQRQPHSNRQQRQNQQNQQPGQTPGTPRAVTANRPLNRVQNAQRERNMDIRGNRSRMQETITKSIDFKNMPSLDTLPTKSDPRQRNQPAPKPAPVPQFKTQPSPPPTFAAQPPSRPSAAPAFQQTRPMPDGVESPNQPVSHPLQSFQGSEDPFSDELEQARKALVKPVAPPPKIRYQERDFDADEPKPESIREIAQKNWQTRENERHHREEQESHVVEQRREGQHQSAAQRSEPPKPEAQSTFSGEASNLSLEEERMLEMLLARKNKSAANPSKSAIESIFGEQDQQTRNALVDESKKRVQAEQAKRDEDERRLNQNRGPRFSTIMVNNRGEPDETPFENAQSWNIMKSRQQQPRQRDDATQPTRYEQEKNNGGASRYTPMSAGDIDARFEEYRKQRPRFGGFNIEFDRNAERGDRDERRPREHRSAGQDMAAAFSPPTAMAGSAEAETSDPAEQEAARKILERNARRASRFVEEDEDEAPRAAPTKGRRGRSEEVDEDEDDKPRRGRRSRFEDDDDDVEGNFGSMRNDRNERKKARQAKKDKAAKEAARQAARQVRRAEAMTPINLPEFVSVSKLAQLTNVTYQEMAEKMGELGFENTSHDHVLGAEEAGLIAMEYNFDPTLGAQDKAEAEERDLKPLPEPEAEDKEFLPVRPPVVAIMGHVDHGKTTILDYLRKSSIAATEHGGITQHIGAFSVALSSGKTITFLDTPGHAAFLEMRKRGATVTDIIILVVAADDSVKPQTIEAIKHAQSANVPIIVAVNKIDKEEANVDRVKQDLARHGVEIEDFGGETQVVPVSGKTGQGIDELEDAAVTLSEILDHRADTEGQVEGWVLEATTKKAGRVATVLVRRGTIKPGTIIVAGKTWARVRSLRNEAGVTQMSAGPGTPVEVDGWRDQPSAGDEVLQAPNEQKAADVVAFRDELEERIRMAEDMEKINTQRRPA